MDNLKCSSYGTCGACTLLDVPYGDQLKQKTNYIKQLFYDNEIQPKVYDCVGMYYPYNYRNKLHLAVREGNRGECLVGFFEENSNRVVNIESCLLNGAWSKTLIDITKQFVSDFKIKPYNKLDNSGTLKYVIARKLSNDILVTLVATTENFGGKDWFYKELLKHFSHAGLYVNINRRTDNAVFDNDKFIHKYGLTKLQSSICGIKFSLSPNSFFQVNEQIAEKIYKCVSTEIGGNNKLVLDLYSGIGITGLIFAKTGAKTICVELDSSATDDAKALTLHNHLQNMQVICGRCEDVVPMLNIDPKQQLSVFLDPPRAGADESVLDSVLKLSPSNIVYLSCDPETLVRDLKVILKSGMYSIKFIQPYDMFPHTTHIETLAVLNHI